MASLKDLKNRITSITSTQKITRAQQMVAAAKLRKAQEAAEAGRPYAERMDGVLAGLAAAFAGTEGGPALLAGNGKSDTHLLIVATADRGLCGGFNSSIARLARDKARELIGDGKKVKFLCVGKKGYDIVNRLYPDNQEEMISMREVKTVGYADGQGIANRVLAMFDAGEFDVATLIYSKFVNVISQIPTAQQIIPATIPVVDDDAETASVSYDYEPDEEEILKSLLPTNVAVQIFRALLENRAGEMGAKMTSMDNATRNAGEMIDSLTLTYNRQRQAQITKELIEIISGAEAL